MRAAVFILIVGLLATPLGAAGVPAAAAVSTPAPDATAASPAEESPGSPVTDPSLPEVAPSPDPAPTDQPEGAEADVPGGVEPDDVKPEPEPEQVQEPDGPDKPTPDSPAPVRSAVPPVEGDAIEPETESTPEKPIADAERARAPPGSLRIGILAAGLPESPRIVWSEGFEQGVTTTTASGLTAYASGRFSASSGWGNGTNCTGVIVNYTAAYPNASFCPTQNVLGASSSLTAREVRRLADVLGQLSAGVTGSASASSPANGSTTGTSGTQSNHALVAYPYTSVAGGTTVSQTTAGIAVSAPGSRYYTARFDAGGASCGTGNASLTMSLFTGTTTLLNAFAAPVVPCAATGSVFYTSPPLAPLSGLDPALSASARAATYSGSTAALLTPAQIAAAQVRLTNTVTGTGSAFAVDNLRVLDVSPALDATFTSSPAVAGTPTTLTYTVTNTSDALAKSDWSFTATLPSGLVVAGTPAVGGTCANATGTAFAVTAAAGSGSVGVVGGDLTAGATSCTITVNVVAANAGVYSSGTATSAGLIVSLASSLTVQPASTITVRKIITARTSPTDQFTLSVRSGTTVLASATTTGATVDLQPVQVGPLAVTAGANLTIHEAPTAGAGLSYSASYECSRDGTVIAAGTSASGSLAMPSEQGAQVVCTFTNAPQTQRLACDTNHYYAITADGALVQGDIVSGAAITVGTWNTGTNANGLGITANGETAYALRRSTDGTDVASILKWTPAGGFQTLANTAYNTVAAGADVPGALVAGAVDPRTGRYVFGKYNGSAFYLWSFTESAPAASRFAYLGSFTTTGSPDGNGDFAFDARGNLYVLGAAEVNSQSSAVIFTVTADSLAAANGGALPVAGTSVRALTGLDATPVFGDANGIAFSPRGTAYVSSATVAYEFDATTWARVPGSGRTAVAHTDLASCSSPAAITVLKNVVGRTAATDQFTLTLSNAGSVVATATTTGSATGRQTRQIGPVPAPVGTSFTVSEAMATGSASTIGVYTVIYECWADGVRLSTGTATAGQVTIPNRQSVNVVCTFFNSPRPVASVTLTKQVLDPASGAVSPASGWSLSTTAVATIGTATVLPSEAPRQQTDAAGRAVWSVLFGSAAARATLTISEEQRSGFVFERGTCTVNGTATPASFTTAGSIVSATLPGIASSATVACTIVNRPVANLTLVAEVAFGSAIPSDWVVSAAAPAGVTALPGPTGRSGTGAVSAVPVTPGIPYRLNATAPRTTYVQVGAWRCVEASGDSVPVTASRDTTIPAGGDVTCTVTFATASMTVVKEVVGAQAGFEPADWTITATPDAFSGGAIPTESRTGAVFASAGNAASTFEARPGHGYTLTETPTRANSRLAYQTLRLERLSGTSWVTVPSGVVSAPAAGTNVTYRFVNAPVQPTTLPLTGGMSSDLFTAAGAALLIAAVAAVFLRSSALKRRRA